MEDSLRFSVIDALGVTAPNCVSAPVVAVCFECGPLLESIGHGGECRALGHTAVPVDRYASLIRAYLTILCNGTSAWNARVPCFDAKVTEALLSSAAGCAEQTRAEDDLRKLMCSRIESIDAAPGHFEGEKN